MNKHSITVAGHRTSVSLEQPFWDALADVARTRGQSVGEVITAIDKNRPRGTNLSAALRLFLLEWYRARAQVR